MRCFIGGYSKYQTAKDAAMSKYRKEKYLGPMMDTALLEYAKSMKDIENGIMASDKVIYSLVHFFLV